jgi:hypothetical protein
MSNRTEEADCAEQTMSPPVDAVLAGTSLAGTVLAGTVSHEIAQRMYTRRA